jgi:3-hydroxyacyl-CoA dehydrogenase, NAD binding domain
MTKSIKTVGVCGAAGTMGAGIALVAARTGYSTISYDRPSPPLEKAAQQSSAFLDKSVERGKLKPDVRDAILRSMSHSTDIAALAKCDLVIEAVYEELAVKRELLKRLDAVCAEDTIFASNTSTLSITEIASGSNRPEQVVGMHFCLPAQLMKLIEMSPGIRTSDETFRRAWAWTESCNQIPVRTQDKPGFIAKPTTLEPSVPLDSPVCSPRHSVPWIIEASNIPLFKGSGGTHGDGPCCWAITYLNPVRSKANRKQWPKPRARSTEGRGDPRADCHTPAAASCGRGEGRRKVR